MNPTTIRQSLHELIDQLNDEELVFFYLQVQESIQEETAFTLSDEEIAWLDKERELYMKGEGKTYTWEGVKERIRKKIGTEA